MLKSRISTNQSFHWIARIVFLGPAGVRRRLATNDRCAVVGSIACRGELADRGANNAEQFNSARVVST